jgi:hypothetical protein
MSAIEQLRREKTNLHAAWLQILKEQVTLGKRIYLRQLIMVNRGLHRIVVRKVYFPNPSENYIFPRQYILSMHPFCLNFGPFSHLLYPFYFSFPIFFLFLSHFSFLLFLLFTFSCDIGENIPPAPGG